MNHDELLERIAAVNERFAGALVHRLEIKFMHHLALELSVNVPATGGHAFSHVELNFSNLESVSTRIASVREGYSFTGLLVVSTSPLLDARPRRTMADGTRFSVPPAHHFRVCTDAGDCDFLASDFSWCELYGCLYGKADA